MADLSKTAYERIAGILDELSFIEIGAGASSFYGEEKAGDGVVTGYGTISGRLVYVYAQNPAVCGGSIGAMHAQKIKKIYQMAMNMGAPVLAMIDCAGIRMKEGSGSLFSFGRILAQMSQSSGVVPQIAAIYGSAGGGLSALASMCDFVFVAEGASLFLNSPNAVTGNFEEKCNTADAKFRAEKAGLVDACESAQELALKIRTLFEYLPLNNDEDAPEAQTEDDLNRSVSGIEQLKDKTKVLEQIADDGVFFELRKACGKSTTIGFLRINGRPVGAIANQTQQLGLGGVTKACRFLRFCDAFNIPVLTLCDTSGFATDMKDELELPSALGKLVYAYSSATVPMVTLVTGKAYGTAGLVMGSKSLDTDLVFAWPGASIGIMDRTLLEKLADFKADADTNTAQAAARRGYIDDIIDPAETRQRLAASLEMLYTKNVAVPVKKHGTI